ncbi:unnamed protein product [Prunus armeniaca]
MASSVEAGGSWATQKDIALCQSWVNVSHDPITGNEMKFHHIWKLLNKELGKWRNALTKARENIRSGQNFTDEDCSRFKIIPTGLSVVLNETPLHNSPSTDSPLDSPMETESPLLRPPRPIGRKAAKAKRRGTSNNECQQAHEKEMDDREMKIMDMDASHMSPETKAYWKHRRRDAMRRKLFHDDGPSNTDWLNDENH